MLCFIRCICSFCSREIHTIIYGVCIQFLPIQLVSESKKILMLTAADLLSLSLFHRCRYVVSAVQILVLGTFRQHLGDLEFQHLLVQRDERDNTPCHWYTVGVQQSFTFGAISML